MTAPLITRDRHGAILRPLTPEDLPAAQGLTAALRWPHRQEDWAFMLGLGQGLAAERDGLLVGSTITWNYGPDFATVGLVIVADAVQGKGLGRSLMGAALEIAGSRSMLLNATQPGLPLYRSMGFAPVGDVVQHQGAAFSIGLVPPPRGGRLRPLGRNDGPALAALDAAATGMPRAALIEALLGVCEGVVLDCDGEARGFSLLRRFGRGLVIGPVVAPDAESARALIAHWLGSREGQFLRIDVKLGDGLSPWLEGMGLQAVDTVTGMARGAVPQPSGGLRNYALVTQALG